MEVHGKNGLADIEFSENTINEISQDMDCIEAMKQTIDLNSENINLVCTGTLTNVAKLITKYPDVTSQIKWVSIMGGSFGFGNITPYAEFNFHTDPHAAKLVIQELSNKVILSPLNFTHKVIATSEIRKHMYDDNNEKRSSPIRNVFFRILTFYYKVYAANGFWKAHQYTIHWLSIACFHFSIHLSNMDIPVRRRILILLLKVLEWVNR